MPRKVPAVSCPAKSSLRLRPSMSCEQAIEVESLFEVLANDTRLRLLHELVRLDEACTTELAEALEMKPQAVSKSASTIAGQGYRGQ